MDRVENPLIGREELLAAARGLGFQRAGIAAAGTAGAVGSAGSILVCALSCFRREPDDPSSPGEPFALIAPFARRHYYRDAVRRLGGLAALLAERSGLPREAFRPFSNSRLPEKPLAVAAGLGFLGRNCLVVSPGLGSLFVIAGLELPFPLEPDRPPADWVRPGAACGSCRACREACPTGALEQPGRLDPARCLQAWAGREGEPPREVQAAWGPRLYGCQACQEACPWNRGLSLESGCTLGELGPGLPLRALLGGAGGSGGFAAAAGALRARLRGTALGMGWIAPEALLRGALLAAGHRADPVLRAGVEAWLSHPSPTLAAAARRALERLG